MGRILDAMKPDTGSGTGIAMRLGYRELVTPSMIGLTAGIAMTLLAVVAALGPMDTLETLTFFQRLVYFGAISACEVPICFGCGFLRFT